MAYHVNKNFFKKWTSEMAWVLGIVYSDGNINRSKNGGWRLRIGMQDFDVIDKVRILLKSTHPIKKVSFNQYGRGTWYYKIDIGSKEIFNDLCNLGLSENKTFIKRYPNEIPKEFSSHFIRGYFDGNGWLSSRKWFAEIGSGSIKFLEDIVTVLQDFGFKSNAYKRNTTNGCRLITTSKYFFQWLYNGSTNSTRMDRKFDLFTQKT